MKNILGRIGATTIGRTILMAIMLATMAATPAEAGPTYRLDVTYTNGSIISGPLSFGLSTLPTSVSARFDLGPGQVVGPELGDLSPVPSGIYFDEADVLFGRITFHQEGRVVIDADWNELNGFSMLLLSDGSINGLTYGISLITTEFVDGGIIMNFPLTITGTDIGSGLSFEYEYTESTQTLTVVPVPGALILGSIGFGLVGCKLRRRRNE